MQTPTARLWEGSLEPCMATPRATQTPTMKRVMKRVVGVCPLPWRALCSNATPPQWGLPRDLPFCAQDFYPTWLLKLFNVNGQSPRSPPPSRLPVPESSECHVAAGRVALKSSGRVAFKEQRPAHTMHGKTLRLPRTRVLELAARYKANHEQQAEEGDVSEGEFEIEQAHRRQRGRPVQVGGARPAELASGVDNPCRRPGAPTTYRQGIVNSEGYLAMLDASC